MRLLTSVFLSNENLTIDRRSHNTSISNVTKCRKVINLHDITMQETFKRSFGTLRSKYGRLP